MLRESDLQKLFEPFGEIGNIYFPKPLEMHPVFAAPNAGHGFVRFKKMKHMRRALEAMQSYEVDGHRLRLEEVKSRCWPTDATRRFY